MRILRKSTVLGVCLALGLVGCAAAPTADEAKLEIDQILSQPLDEAEYGKPRRCLSTGLYTQVDIVDDQRLIFRGRGDKAWLNQLRTRCVGLRRNDTLLFELRDNRVCDLDSVSVVDRFLFWRRTGTRCALGKFEPISAEQAAQVKQVLRGD